jgi:hypothetical protein
LINHILLITSTIFIYEFIKFFKFIFIIKSNLKIYKKILNLFKLKNTSELRKEKLILNYSKTLFISSIKIFTVIISVLTFVLILNFFFNSFIDLMISIMGILEITFVLIFYHKIKEAINEKL